MSALSHKHVSAILEKHNLRQIRKIGEGSFGNAILVETSAGASRVCKMIDVSHASMKEAENAVKEAKLLATMKHPYIVRYRQSFADDGWLCILMDFCEGGELAQRIESAKKLRVLLPEDKVMRWFTQAVLALKHLHDRHILHRDLKPSNFFLTKEEVLRVGDFGVAKVLSTTTACARTQIGTPYYLSPEVCQEQPYACPSDVWAMGCILYEMCARRVPFEAKSISQLVDRICRGTTPVVPAAYSEEVRQLCRHLLVRDPASRPSVDKVLRRPEIQGVIRAILEERRREALAEKDAGQQEAISTEAPQARAAARPAPEPALPHIVASAGEQAAGGDAPKQDAHREQRLPAFDGEIRRSRAYSDSLDYMTGGASSSRCRGLDTPAAAAAALPASSRHSTPRLAALPTRAASKRHCCDVTRGHAGAADDFARAPPRSGSVDRVGGGASALGADALGDPCADDGGGAVARRSQTPGRGGLLPMQYLQQFQTPTPQGGGAQPAPRLGLHRSASAVVAAAGDVLAPRARVLPEVSDRGQASHCEVRTGSLPGKGYASHLPRPSPPIMVAAAAAAVASGAGPSFPGGAQPRSLRPISAAGFAILGAA